MSDAAAGGERRRAVLPWGVASGQAAGGMPRHGELLKALKKDLAFVSVPYRDGQRSLIGLAGGPTGRGQSQCRRTVCDRGAEARQLDDSSCGPAVAE